MAALPYLASQLLWNTKLLVWAISSLLHSGQLGMRASTSICVAFPLPNERPCMNHKMVASMRYATGS